MSAGQYLYAIQMGHTGPIKIGIAADPHVRLKQMQTSNPMPLRLLMVVSGGTRTLELDIHNRLAAHRMAGEWFRPDSQVLELMHEEAYQPSGVGKRYSTLHAQCENCGTLTGDSGIWAKYATRPPSPLCAACEEFAALRASGLDPFEDD